LTGERTVMAFDGQNGAQLWTQQRPSEALTLRLPGVLMPVGDTLVVGFSGRLVGLNPDNGSARWEAPIGTPRGVNDVERLVDLIGGVSRQPNSLCVRAYASAVGCVNVSTGRAVWSHAANGATGLSGDANSVFGTEADGKVVSWRRSDGEVQWSSDRFQFRQLTAPVLLGQALVFGDAEGYLHFVAADDGRYLNRLSTDGSGFAAAPVVQGQTLIVVTRKGAVMAFR
jgi:outer membrane protein assembly factor BamB